MLAKTFSSAVIGINAYTVEIEADISSSSLPSFSVVGLPDAAIRESKNRIISAIKNTSIFLPAKAITINLAPAHIKKEGVNFDLPIAIALLQALGYVQPHITDDYIIAGELGLNGQLRPIKGALSIAMHSSKKNLIVPKENIKEAAVVSSKNIYGLNNLQEVIDLLNGKVISQPVQSQSFNYNENDPSYSMDFNDVKGQEQIKRGLEIAASGYHNIILIGPPGSGKSMLAKRLPTILPKMTFDEALETTKIHSVSGILSNKKGLITERPFRSPHHTISYAALVGGGSKPKPGEISLAHNGVLFLDELAEFRRNVLEVMRQPLEEGEILISRVENTILFPAKFMFIAAMNPCPCGYFNDTKKACICTSTKIQNYLSKISGPLLDRIDLHINVQRLPFEKMSEKRTSEFSSEIRKRVKKTQEIQLNRFKDTDINFNAHLHSKNIEKHCVLNKQAQELFYQAISEQEISARAYDRILKVSRTIADMEQSEKIGPSHILEAMSYRTLDKSLF